MVRTNMTGGNIRPFTEYLIKAKAAVAKWTIAVSKNQVAFDEVTI